MRNRKDEGCIAVRRNELLDMLETEDPDQRLLVESELFLSRQHQPRVDWDAAANRR